MSWPGYGNRRVLARRSEQRPGTVLAAAVMGYVEAVLVLFAAVGLFLNVRDAGRPDPTQSGLAGGRVAATVLIELGVVNIVVAVLLMAGSRSVLRGRPAGRVLYSVGAVAQLCLTALWQAGGTLVYADDELNVIAILIFGLPAAVSLVFLWRSRVSSWLHHDYQLD